ncbi:putative ribonuclease h protein, partial [Nicotiana attenuata]
IEHMLFRFTYSRVIWKQCHIKHNYPQRLDNELTAFNWLKYQLRSKKCFNHYIRWTVFLPILIWYIWTTRNGRIFQRNNSYPNISHVISSAQKFFLIGKWGPTNIPKKTIHIKWEPPIEGFFKSNINGSCLGNPGRGGIGEIFRDSNRNWILGFNMGFAHTTNIQMEPMSLLQGLKLAIQKRLTPLVIETDCQELINLLTNDNCLYQNIIDDCRFLLTEAGTPILKHAFKEANGVANKLAKNGCNLDSFDKLMLYYYPPAFAIS